MLKKEEKKKSFTTKYFHNTEYLRSCGLTLPLESLTLSVKQQTKHDMADRTIRHRLMPRLVALGHLPWSVTTGDSTWNASTVPVGRRLAK